MMNRIPAVGAAAVAEPASSAAKSRVRFLESAAAPALELVPAEESSGFELQEDPSFWRDHNVQVVIRIRPLSSSEVSFQGQNKCVRQDSCQTITWTGHPESRFTFDLVADEHVTQENLFKITGVPMVDNCVGGYNSCMFAYGQTGSGKTHTMLGDIEGGGTGRHSANAGMTPRVFEYLFARIQKEEDTKRDEKLQFICKCSFLEIYNEQILDLLDPLSINLQIREDAKKGVYVENLTELEVSSAGDVMQHLSQGAANRKVAATNMNRASSRSHSVFTCVIESKWESQGVTHHRFARLNLVDLAGSERQKSSGAEGDRLKEATNINKSLSTLGLVIMNLVSISNKKSSLHVPYRDSKLTFLLQESLGGNSKTIIIANISPSNCCALETMSTLKFAQRAKFIRNHAIINEDASGDVLSMRIQIQQLKKEVNRLRGLVNAGPDSQETGIIFPWSSEASNFDGGNVSFSPLTIDKRSSQRKDYEPALVAAFRRLQEKEETMKSLLAEKQAVENLCIQRTEEVRSLKMRLRFREEGIRRLEAVAAGKLAADCHFLQEKNELIKEVEILRNQVDRNPEVTRFAMENLSLTEEVRRLHSFVKEGEREMMSKEISILQDRLLEALDWKLMHEKEGGITKDLSMSWESATSEELEFLQLQSIQNQREIEALRKNLNFCLEAKEKLERRVDELSQLDEGGKMAVEIKTMVDAIASASQREAEAHETAIMLAKENEELCAKLDVVIKTAGDGASYQLGNPCEQLNGLEKFYLPCQEQFANVKVTKDTDELQEQLQEMDGKNEKLLSLYEKATKNVEQLERQLQEMNEENEKLMGLYENAMQERDDFKRIVEEKPSQVRTDADKLEESVKSVTISEEVLQFMNIKFDTAQDKLMDARKSAKLFGLLQQNTHEVTTISHKIYGLDYSIRLRKQEIENLNSDANSMHEKAAVAYNKLLAVRLMLQNLYFNGCCWEERLDQAKMHVNSCYRTLESKKNELIQVQILRRETESDCMKFIQCESNLRKEIGCLKSKLQDADNRRKESEKVLFALDNNSLEYMDQQKSTKLGKASDLMKSEEERTRLTIEKKQAREKLVTVQKDIVSLKRQLESLDARIRFLEEKIKEESMLFEAAQLMPLEVLREKQLFTEMEEEGKAELHKGLINYQQLIFGSYLKEAEITICEDVLKQETQLLEESITLGKAARQRPNELHKISQDVERDLGDVERCLTEAKSSIVLHAKGTLC